MQHQFTNETTVPISAGSPTIISSTITASGVTGAIRNVIVAIDLDHTYTGDLVINLIAPNGNAVLLVDRIGGSGDNFQQTVFDDRSGSSIRRASPPFYGRFQPATPLQALNGSSGNGDWTLEVSDRASQDGGSLNAWSIAFTSEQSSDQPSNFEIKLVFGGGLSATQQHAFTGAKQRWEEIILGDPTQANGATVIIDAAGVEIDGAGTANGNILGQAAPTHLRDGSGLPDRGFMEFDSFDLDRMEADGSLQNVIFHEMAHVLGHGTIWGRKRLLVGGGTRNPRFIGRRAMTEFGLLMNSNNAMPVPVANSGRQGSTDSHWRESVLGNELLTSRLNPGINPVS